MGIGQRYQDKGGEDLYKVLISPPIDYWLDYIHISEFSNFFDNWKKENPRSDITFKSCWTDILDRLHWAWACCDYIDKDLRSSDVYINFHYHLLPIELEKDMCKISVLFKCDNNGTIYAIVDYRTPFHPTCLPHENDELWTILKEEKK